MWLASVDSHRWTHRRPSLRWPRRWPRSSRAVCDGVRGAGAAEPQVNAARLGAAMTSDHLMAAMDEHDIRATVTSLARPRAGGGYSIERAAILAAGADATAIEAWIVAHDGVPEQVPSTRASGGLHGHRDEALRPPDRSPRRYLFPAGALQSARNPT